MGWSRSSCPAAEGRGDRADKPAIRRKDTWGGTPTIGDRRQQLRALYGTAHAEVDGGACPSRRCGLKQPLDWTVGRRTCPTIDRDDRASVDRPIDACEGSAAQLRSRRVRQAAALRMRNSAHASTG